MKTAIVYYSLSGNTEFTAKKIADKVNADLIKIDPVKNFPTEGAKKFIWGGRSAVFGEEPKLLPYTFDLEKYDRIIIGTPVWASTFTPPIRTFIKENPDIKGKKLSAFICSSGDGADKVRNKMCKFIGISNFESELFLIDPKDNPDFLNEEKIEAFCSSLKG